MLLRQHLHQSIPTVLRTRVEPGKNWLDVANEIGFSPEQIDRTAKDFALNNWIDKRLKNYIKNDLGTPKDPVRDLADQGITHMNDLGEGYERLHPSNQEVIYKMRERQGQQKEDYGKTNAGKDWENRSEYAVEPRSLREWAGDNPQRMHNNPGFQKALERDSEAKLNLFDSGAIRDLGFDHLTDELHAAIQSDSDLPQHLRLSTKDLERMTVPDAVRHVAKINKYRADLAEKATVKKLGEFRQNFPALKIYDNGMAWHELREPVIHADQNKNIEILDKALKEEGELMGHCVGGYTDDVVDGYSRIFTLRDAKGKPHVTIETVPTTGIEETDAPFSEHHDVSQIRGKGNKKVVPKYHEYVLDFLNNVKPHDRLYDAEELYNVNAVDTLYTTNMSGGHEISDNIRAAVPDLPRFISKDLFDQLVNQHYIKKSRELAKKSSDEKAEPSKDYVDIAKRRLFGLSLGPKQDHLPAVVNPETPSSSPTSTELTTQSAPTTPSEPLKTISPLDYAAQALMNMPMTRRQILKTPVNAAISHVGRGLIGNPVKAVSGMLKKEAINHAVDHVISTLWDYGHPAFGDTIDNETRQDIANQLTHAGLSESTSKPAEHFAEHFTEKDLKEAYHRSADRFNHVWSNSDIEGMANDSAREAIDALGPDVDYEDLLDYAHSKFKKAVVNEATKTLPNSVSGDIAKRVTKEILEGHGSLHDPYGTDALPDAVTKAVSDFYNEKYNELIENIINDEEGGGSSVGHIENMVGAALQPLQKNLSQEKFKDINQKYKELKSLSVEDQNKPLESNPTAVKLKKDFLSALDEIPVEDKAWFPFEALNYPASLLEQYEQVTGIDTNEAKIDNLEQGLRQFARSTGQEFEPFEEYYLEDRLENETRPKEIKKIKQRLKDIKDNEQNDKPPTGYKVGGHIKSLEHDRMKFELMMRGKHG
jgi:hypothetical protein